MRARSPSGSTGDEHAARPRRPKRLVKVRSTKTSIGPGSRDIEHERAVAIYDLVEENFFAPGGARRRALLPASFGDRATG